MWQNVSVPGEFLHWKAKLWESLSCRRRKVAPNRADHLTSTHPQNHKELWLYLLTAAAGGRVCARLAIFAEILAVFNHVWYTNPSIQMAKLRPQDYTMLVTCAEKKKNTLTHSSTNLAWSLPLPVPFCMRAIICLQSCAFQMEHFRRNPLLLPVYLIPELSSSARLRVRATWETEAGIVQAPVSTTMSMTSRKRPNVYFKLFLIFV